MDYSSIDIDINTNGKFYAIVLLLGQDISDCDVFMGGIGNFNKVRDSQSVSSETVCIATFANDEDDVIVDISGRYSTASIVTFDDYNSKSTKSLSKGTNSYSGVSTSLIVFGMRSGYTVNFDVTSKKHSSDINSELWFKGMMIAFKTKSLSFWAIIGIIVAVVVVGIGVFIAVVFCCPNSCGG